jgi:dihydrofolate synthase / folylpolyglutamate synthase
MNYQETLNYLYQQLPMYHRIGAAAYKADLANTIALIEHLGRPEHQFRSIHIAGTNGKGSVSHFLASILQAAGYKVGLYTSPHYVDFRERIKINGKPISKQKVVGFVAAHQPFLEELSPSFFEMTVGLAFDYFRDEKVDYAIIETGLGGRLDSTNVITPVLSVITNISYDHMALLGNTLPLIAAEKAGIIKPGIPVVLGEHQPEIRTIFDQRAQVCKSSLVCAQDVCTVKTIEPQPSKMRSFFDLCLELPNASPYQFDRLELDVSGPYQSKNLCTAVTAITMLNSTHFGPEHQITEAQIRDGLAHVRNRVRMMGRWQYISTAPDVLCDSAHNEAGLKLLFGGVQQIKYAKLHIVCGFANDKDLGGILPLFPKDATYYFAKANVPRGLAADLLRSEAATFGLIGKGYTTVNRALAAARKTAHHTDLIVVTGSIFVLGEVLARTQNAHFD